MIQKIDLEKRRSLLYLESEFSRLKKIIQSERMAFLI